MPLECGIIFDGIPEGAISRKVGLIWGIPDKAGKLGDVDKSYRPLTDVEMELARTKKELAEVKMERDILKKAAAYFARESLPGTR